MAWPIGSFMSGRLHSMTTSGIPLTKEHDVGSAGLLATTALDHELLGHVVGVVFGMFPVDVIELKALSISLDRLLQALSHAQQVIRFLIGWQQAVIHYVLECLNCREDIALAEGVRAAPEQDGVLPAKLLRQYLVEELRCPVGRLELRPLFPG